MMKKSLVIIIAIALLGLAAFGLTRLEDKTPFSSAAPNSLGAESYRDGTFRGASAETPYGPVQVSVNIENGRIVDIKSLKMPSGDDRSREITRFSDPALKANALKAQSADIDFVTGATSTSYGYQQSLQAALDRAAGSSFIHLKSG